MPDIHRIVQRQKDFFSGGTTLDLQFRLRMLRRLRSCLDTFRDELIGALYSDMRKAPFEAFTGDIGTIRNEIDYALRRLPAWIRSRRVATPLACFYGRSRILPRPYGVCLILSPWNYPVQLTLSPLVGAIAAGNCAILKPSEISAATTPVIARMVRDNFPGEFITVIEGDAVVAKDACMQDVDYIFFSGSTSVGRQVMKAAAEKLVPVTLELGGKCPCIIDRDVDLGTAAKRVAWGKFYCAGQMCVAPDYLVVHRDIKDTFLEKLCGHLRSFYGANPKKSPDYARIINRRNFERLVSLIDRTKVFYGGDTDEQELYIAPTIIEPVTWDDRCMQDEIFGPLLPVLTYDSLDDLCAVLARRPRPLALYFFSSNRSRCKKILRDLPFGGGCINDTLMHIIGPHLPFGGVGPSGMGRYHGEASFNTFSYQKGVLTRPFCPDIPLRYPPFTAGKQRLGKLMFR
jgi:aldehyde dehydrogenase (NAD+)